MKFTKEAIVFITVVTLLSGALFAGGIWAVNTQRNRDTRDVQALNNELGRLESQYQAELGYTQDESLIYPNADQVRTQLADLSARIKEDRKTLLNQPNAALARRAAIEQNIQEYTRSLEGVTKQRNDYANNFMATAKQQIDKYKRQLDDAMQRNRALSAQLTKTIRAHKGSPADLSKLKAQKAQLDRLTGQQTALRSQLDSVTRDRDELRALLERSEQLIKEQAEQIAQRDQEIERLRAQNRRAINFRAQYNFRNRLVNLSQTEKNLARQVDDINISFDVPEGFFETDAEKVVYMTLYKNNLPYRFNKQPLKVTDNRANQTFQIKPKLDRGDYYFRLTYNEQPIMPDYKFNID